MTRKLIHLVTTGSREENQGIRIMGSAKKTAEITILKKNATKARQHTSAQKQPLKNINQCQKELEIIIADS